MEEVPTREWPLAGPVPRGSECPSEVSDPGGRVTATTVLPARRPRGQDDPPLTQIGDGPGTIRCRGRPRVVRSLLEDPDHHPLDHRLGGLAAGVGDPGVVLPGLLEPSEVERHAPVLQRPQVVVTVDVHPHPRH